MIQTVLCSCILRQELPKVLLFRERITGFKQIPLLAVLFLSSCFELIELEPGQVVHSVGDLKTHLGYLLDGLLTVSFRQRSPPSTSGLEENVPQPKVREDLIVATRALDSCLPQQFHRNFDLVSLHTKRPSPDSPIPNSPSLARYHFSRTSISPANLQPLGPKTHDPNVSLRRP